MELFYEKSFLNDLKNIGNKKDKIKVAETIEEIRAAGTPAKISNLRKLEGYTVYYRIRLGDYRLGIKIDNNTVTLIRFLHRKDIYRYFP